METNAFSDGVCFVRWGYLTKAYLYVSVQPVIGYLPTRNVYHNFQFLVHAFQFSSHAKGLYQSSDSGS